MAICRIFMLALAIMIIRIGPLSAQTELAVASQKIFGRDNLVAWCIVPFDAKKRGPEERAVMLKQLGFRHFAYDWRSEHIPSFDAEIEALKKQQIELTAWWFPGSLDAEARQILKVLEKHKLKTQLWVTGGGAATKSPEEQRQRIVTEAARLRPIIDEAARIGCTVALYNHGGWFGEPENQLALIEHLKSPHVGIVYNLHHGHDHLDRFPQLLKKMLPHLWVLNLNGMVKDGDRLGKKILPLGSDDLDLKLLREIVASGYHGPIGILGHTDDDAEARLRDNLDGLDWLHLRLQGKEAGPRPRYRTVAPKPDDHIKLPVQKSEGNHWGPQAIGISWKEADSSDDRWKNMEIGRFLASSLPLPKGRGTVARGLSIRLGDKREATICYDTENLKVRAAWRDGFLRFTTARFGLISPPEIDGKLLFASGAGAGWQGEVQYRGLYPQGDRVVLSYTITPASKDVVAVLESPWIESRDGEMLLTRDFELGASPALTLNLADVAKGERAEIVRVEGVEFAVRHDGDRCVAWFAQGTGRLSASGTALHLEVPTSATPRRLKLLCWSGARADLPKVARAFQASESPVAMTTQPGRRLWPNDLFTQGVVAKDDAPYVIDTVTIPFDNPYRALFFVGGHDFFSNGDAALCTAHGDVWRISGLDRFDKLVWKRYATGLFQPLGLKIVNDQVYVLGRDQITRLHDRNGDGEADFYESFCNLGPCSTGGHDYSTCLETDRAGSFYFLAAREGVIRVSADGKKRDVIASGFRNPNGMGMGPGDQITVSPQEGDWTPASNVAEVKRDGYYGFGGPKVTTERPLGYDPPLCWIPRRLDNSSGGQVWVEGDRWGPLAGNMFHLSYGQCRMMLVLREELRPGVVQGGVVPMSPFFSSGIMRGQVHPRDGQLYVSGLKGWTTAATHDGCLQRLRYTGKAIDMPVRMRSYQNGIALTFTRPLDRRTAEDPGSYFVEQWNYKYAARYGSPDYKITDPKQEGHDEVAVKSATLLEDGKTVFLEFPDLQPVMQLGISMSLKAADQSNIRQAAYLTLNELGKDRMDAKQLAQRPNSTKPALDESRLKPGLLAHYEQDGLADVRTLRLAAFHTQQGERPTPFLEPGSFRIKLEGFLRVPLRGDYVLRLTGLGTGVLKVNGKALAEVIDERGFETQAKVELQRGLNSIEIVYFSSRAGNAALRLFWAGDDFTMEPVPPTVFFHDASAQASKAYDESRLGRELSAERSCHRCHAMSEESKGMLELSLAPPSLARAGQRLQPAWMMHWLLDPHQLRKEARMPAMLDENDPERRTKAANLAAYLSTLKGNTVQHQDEKGRAKEGARLYQELNCTSCHRLSPPSDRDEFERLSLYHVAAKYREGALEEYLKRPHAEYAGSRMPDFRLSFEEIADLVTYLRQHAKGKISQSVELAQADAKQGQALFVSLRCIQCHASDVPMSLAAAIPTRNLSAGCLASDSMQRGTAPNFHLSLIERESLVKLQSSGAKKFTSHEPIDDSTRLIKSLKCTSCHQRDNTPSPRWSIQEEETGLPPEVLPNLTLAGEKLRASWTEDYLVGKIAYRPRASLKSRMPAFPAYAKSIAHGLAAEHGVSAQEPAPTPIKEELAKVGQFLTLPRGLDCRQCHALAEEPLLGDAKTKIAVGIPLSYSRDRLRHEYFQRFVLDPPRIDPQTKMPRFILDGRTTKVAAIYDGDAHRQLEAIWHYMQSLPSEDRIQRTPELHRSE